MTREELQAEANRVIAALRGFVDRHMGPLSSRVAKKEYDADPLASRVAGLATRCGALTMMIAKGSNGKEALAEAEKMLAAIFETQRGLLARLDTQAQRIKALEERPTIHYEGTFKEGVGYLAGAAVTHAGSVWIAKATTTVRPGIEGSGWQLAAKRGADGRDAR
jgi:hypothetical protein